MAELDEIVQKIMLDGDTEVLAKFQEIGSEGVKTFQELSEAAEKGASGMLLFGNAIAGLGAAFIGLAGSIVGFVEANDEAIQKTALLGEAFGATIVEITNLEAAFASLGVGTKTFEAFATRLTVTIAREWPEIAASIRTAATEASASQDRISQATLRVADAQRNLLFQGDQTSSAMASANLKVEQSFIALQTGAQKALDVIRDNVLSVQSATLGLEGAEQRLAALQGRPVSEADKKALELKEAQLAVDKAREDQQKALQKQQQDAAEARLKQAQLEQTYADAQLKRDVLIQEQTNARAKAELQLREAVVAREQAEERASQEALKSVPAIVSAIKGITEGSKEAASAIDLSQVSVRNLVNGIIAAAAEGNKLPPTGMKVLSELMKVLNSDTGQFITQQQRLAVVQQLSSRGFGSVTIAASELLKALEKGPAYFNNFTNAAQGAFFTTDKGKENVAAFRDEMERLGATIDVVNRNFAALASPLITKFLESIRESLTSSTGTLKLFVDGIASIGAAVGAAITGITKFAESIDHAFHLEEGRTLQIVIAALVVAVGLFASAWAAIPAIIAVVVVSIGYISDHLQEIGKFIEDNRAKFVAWSGIIAGIVAFIFPIQTAIALVIGAVVLLIENWDKVKEVASAALDAIVNNPFTKWLADVLAKVKSIGETIAGWFGGGGPGATPNGPASTGSEQSVEGHATGGYISGPGTGTSDSIPARLSNGEFVIRSAAVSRFGTDFLNAVNSMSLPMFASGGPVGTPARLAGGGAIGPQSTLNLSIDGQTFRGLRGPTNVVSDLSDFAISRQASSAGRKPDWVR